MLGYTLAKTPELPASDKLAALIADGTAADEVSTRLVSVGLVKPEHVGKLQLGLLPAGLSWEEASAKLSDREHPAFTMVPVGEWTFVPWQAWAAHTHRSVCAQSDGVNQMPLGLGADSVLCTGVRTPSHASVLIRPHAAATRSLCTVCHGLGGRCKPDQ